MHQILPLPSAFSSESMVLKTGMWNVECGMGSVEWELKNEGEWEVD